jgi:hypothetical protein
MKKAGKKAKYEADRIKFVKEAHYVPDWKIREGLYVETKGYFSPSNRANLLAFREQHPNITVCLVFQNSSNKLNSKSKTTYGEWCDKHDIRWWDIRKGLPKWLWEI